MKITTIGRGTIGGPRARVWTAAGPAGPPRGHEGGDAADADVVLLAAPYGAVVDALEAVAGLQGKIVIDATNRLGGEDPPAGYPSAAEYVRAQTGGPTAKAFNLNFGALLDRAATGPSRPSNIWVGDDEARGAVEQLTRDIGMEPLNGGTLDAAATQEAFAHMLMAMVKDAGGLVFYRFAAPERF